MASIAVALSGGGYRAAMFGLGVVLYLVDAAKNREVTSISSVSGGSITNAFLGQMQGYHQRTSADFWPAVSPLAKTIAHKTLWSTLSTWVYLMLLSLSLIGIVHVCFGVVHWYWWMQLLLFLVLLLQWGWVVQLRGVVAGRAYASHLFSPHGSPTRLASIETDIDHIICATHLNAGEHFYFSGRFVYAYRFGWGQPGKLPLHAAVQASAAFPGGFPPRWMRTKPFRFQGGRNRHGPLPWLVTLTDGGIYDNMADQWPSGAGERQTPPGLALKVPDHLIVVNTSAGLAWSTVRRLQIPFLGEVLALLRDISVMYDNSSSLRMQALVQQFRARQHMGGALVYIEQSPYQIPEAYANGNSLTTQRANAVLEKLGDHKAAWQEITQQNVQVKTTLSKLGPEVAARLARHGYVLAMANLHVILDFPLVEIPNTSEFMKLVSQS